MLSRSISAMAGVALAPRVRSAVLVDGVGGVLAACNFGEERQFLTLSAVADALRLAGFLLLVSNTTLAVDVESPHVEVASICDGCGVTASS